MSPPMTKSLEHGEGGLTEDINQTRNEQRWNVCYCAFFNVYFDFPRTT